MDLNIQSSTEADAPLHADSARPTLSPSVVRARGLRWRDIVFVLLFPLVFVGPALLPGKRLLPILPISFEPRASENVEAAQRDRADANFLCSTRLFPVWTREIDARAEWRRFEPPSWAPKVGMGSTLAAQGDAGLFFPLNALAQLVPPDIAAGWIALAALTLAGLGMLCFLRARGISEISAWFGVAAVQSSGIALANLQLASHFEAALCLPWMLFGIERCLRRESAGGAIVAASVGLAFLAGDVHVAFLATATALCYALMHTFAARTPRHFAITSAWILVGVALGAAQWLPELEARAKSSFASTSTTELRAASLPLAALATLVLPDFFGTPSAPDPAPGNAAAWYTTRVDDADRAASCDARTWSLFAGIGALLLAFTAVASRPKRVWIPLVLHCCVLAFVLWLPPLAWIGTVPGFDLGAPSDAGLILWITSAWLAALGLDALLERAFRACFAARIGLLVLVVAACVLYFGYPPRVMHSTLTARVAERFGTSVIDVARTVSSSSVDAFAERWARADERLLCVALGAFVALAWIMLSRRSALARAAPWFVLALVEGGMLAHAHLAPRTLGDAPLIPRSVAIEGIRAAAGDGRVACFVSDPDRADTTHLPDPDLLRASGLSDLRAHVPYPDRSLVELAAAADAACTFRGAVAAFSDPKAIGSPLLDVMRVTCVVSRDPLVDLRLTPVFQRTGLHVYRRERVQPAALFVRDLVTATNAESALSFLAQRGVDPHSGAVVASDDLGSNSAGEPGAAVLREVQIGRPSPDRLDARVSDGPKGWLVFFEQFDAGWKATVNGEDADVVRVDHACRAVPIPSGACVVRTKYEPWSMRFGGGASLAALVIMLFFALRRPRPRPLV